MFAEGHIRRVEAKNELKSSDATTEHSSTTRSDQQPPYTIFTKRQRTWILFVASFAAVFSTISSYIYFPAIVPMARDLNVSVTLVNLTVTSYLIVAGIAPAFMGDIADQSGRRPAYIIMFLLMIGSNIGLAVQNSYPALFVLRMVQSAGSSGKPYIPDSVNLRRKSYCC